MSSFAALRMTCRTAVWVTNLVTGSVYQHRSLALKGAATVHCWQEDVSVSQEVPSWKQYTMQLAPTYDA